MGALLFRSAEAHARCYPGAMRFWHEGCPLSVELTWLLPELLQSSPEMLLGARCTERSDIYSYGEWDVSMMHTWAKFACV